MDPEPKSKYVYIANVDKLLPEVTTARENTKTKKEEIAKDSTSQEKKDQFKQEQEFTK